MGLKSSINFYKTINGITYVFTHRLIHMNSHFMMLMHQKHRKISNTQHYTKQNISATNFSSFRIQFKRTIYTMYSIHHLSSDKKKKRETKVCEIFQTCANV